MLEIAKIAKCRIENIRGHLDRMNVERRNFSEAGRKYKLNEDYFEHINSEEKAYILGFLFADGYNNEIKNQISIRLHKKDEDILYIIRDILYPNKDKNIKLYQEKYVDLTINSLKMSKSLAKLGCIQKKSLVLTFPQNLPTNLVKHFMRGYFDGDGCISVKQEIQLNLTGTIEFLNSFQKILIEELNLTKTKFSKRRRNVECYTMFYKGKDNCIKILNFLYSDCKISLKRKNNLYLSILSQ